MAKIEFKKIEELYKLHEKRNEYARQGMDAMISYGVESKEADEAYNKAKEVDEEIEYQALMLNNDIGLVYGLQLVRIIDAIYPLSISRVLKCLEVCGFEVVL